MRWVCPKAALASRRNLGSRGGLRPVYALHAGLCNDHRGVHDLPLYFVRAANALGAWAYGRTWTVMGPWDLGRWYRPLAVLSVVGCVVLIVLGMQPPNERSSLGCRRFCGGAGCGMVWLCPPSLPGASRDVHTSRRTIISGRPARSVTSGWQCPLGAFRRSRNRGRLSLRMPIVKNLAGPDDNCHWRLGSTLCRGFLAY